jgi:heme/copper-type cytochrome/quinol oxidase subunit 2
VNLKQTDLVAHDEIIDVEMMMVIIIIIVMGMLIIILLSIYRVILDHQEINGKEKIVTEM